MNQIKAQNMGNLIPLSVSEVDDTIYRLRELLKSYGKDPCYGEEK